MQIANPELKVKYRKIPSLKFLYEISSDGKLRNVKSKKHLSVRVNKKGYCEVSINGFNVQSVHRLVAEVWVKNTKYPNLPLNSLVVNHINFNKQDNRAVNLEWVTQKDNIQHDWNNGHREHLREQLRRKCRDTFTGRTVTAENVERCRAMSYVEQERRKALDICYGGCACMLVTPNRERLPFKSISRAVHYIARKEQLKFSTIYRNLYKRHFAHGYQLILDKKPNDYAERQ